MRLASRRTAAALFTQSGQSLRTDLRLLFLTFKLMLGRKGAR